MSLIKLMSAHISYRTKLYARSKILYNRVYRSWVFFFCLFFFLNVPYIMAQRDYFFKILP